MFHKGSILAFQLVPQERSYHLPLAEQSFIRERKFMSELVERVYVLKNPRITDDWISRFKCLEQTSKKDHTYYMEAAKYYVTKLIVGHKIIPPCYKKVDLENYAVAIYMLDFEIQNLYDHDIRVNLRSVIDYIADSPFWKPKSLNPLSLLSPSKEREIRYFEIEFQIEQGW